MKVRDAPPPQPSPASQGREQTNPGAARAVGPVLFVVVRHLQCCCYSCCKRNLSGLPPLRRGRASKRGAICGRPSSPVLLLLMLQGEPLRTPSLATRGRVGEGANRCCAEYKLTCYAHSYAALTPAPTSSYARSTRSRSHSPG